MFDNINETCVHFLRKTSILHTAIRYRLVSDLTLTTHTSFRLNIQFYLGSHTLVGHDIWKNIGPNVCHGSYKVSYNAIPNCFTHYVTTWMGCGRDGNHLIRY